jgi:hypothetical protein
MDMASLPSGSVYFGNIGSSSLYYWVGSDGSLPDATLIFASNGTPNGAVQIADLGVASVEEVASLGSTSVFAATSSSGTTLYGTDGTPGGTVQVLSFGSGVSFQAAGTLGSNVLIESGGSVYSTNGTVSGTATLISSAGSVQLLGSAFGLDYFEETSGSTVQVFTTDGTTAGTNEVMTGTAGDNFSLTQDAVKAILSESNSGGTTVQTVWVNGATDVAQAAGQEFVWGSSIAGSWDNASNWNDLTTGTSPALVAPGAADSVTIDNTSSNITDVVSGTGSAAYLITDGSVALAGQFAVGTAVLGAVNYQTGTVSVGASDSLSVAGQLSSGGAAIRTRCCRSPMGARFRLEASRWAVRNMATVLCR